MGLWSPGSGFGWAGLLQFDRVCASASAVLYSWRGLHSGVGEDGPRLTGLCVGDVCGSLGGVGGHGVCVSLWRACVGCRVWGAARVASWGRSWRASVGLWAGGGGLCRRAWGCERWWVSVGPWMESWR